MLPAVVAELFLKQVQRQDNKLVFVVGERDTATSDTTLEVDVADLLPVVSDNVTMTGTGVSGNPLKVNVSGASGNLLESRSDGLYVAATATHTTPPLRNVRILNASGAEVLAYAYNTEQ